jgi:hypothetical protein
MTTQSAPTPSGRLEAPRAMNLLNRQELNKGTAFTDLEDGFRFCSGFGFRLNA